MDKLAPDAGHIFESGKTYTHSQGLSCCFRQWRATHSHCKFLHGYSLQVTITFRSKELDDRNWVMDFGDLKWLKQWLQDTFDHKTLVALDDPNYDNFAHMYELGIIDIIWTDHVGCEAFAQIIFDYIAQKFFSEDEQRVFVQEVEVKEHEGNFARYRRNS